MAARPTAWKYGANSDPSSHLADGVNDVMPSHVEGLANPLHELVLVSLGMPLLDNLDLETLAREARQRGRWTFLFVGLPLRVPGGTGSPLNPLAIF